MFRIFASLERSESRNTRYVFNKVMETTVMSRANIPTVKESGCKRQAVTDVASYHIIFQLVMLIKRSLKSPLAVPAVPAELVTNPLINENKFFIND